MQILLEQVDLCLDLGRFGLGGLGVAGQLLHLVAGLFKARHRLSHGEYLALCAGLLVGTDE